MVQCKHTATVYAFFRSGPLTITSTKLGLPEENTGPLIFLFTAHTSQVTTGDPYLALTMCSLSPKVLTYSLRKAISSVLYWNSLWALVTSWHRSFCWFLPLWPCAEGNPVLEDSVFRSGYSLPSLDVRQASMSARNAMLTYWVVLQLCFGTGGIGFIWGWGTQPEVCCVCSDFAGHLTIR